LQEAVAADVRHGSGRRKDVSKIDEALKQAVKVIESQLAG